MEKDKLQGSQGNQSIDRCFDIIEMLVQAEGSMSIKEIAGRLNMSISGLHSILYSMIKRGYVTHLGPRQGYVIGPTLSLLSISVSMENQLVSLSKPIMNELREGVGDETCYLGYFQNVSVLTLLTELSTRRISVGNSSTIGPEKLHASSMGKLLLAHLPLKVYGRWKERMVRLRSFTEFTIRRFEQLESELVQIRELGFAVNDQESDEGVYTIAYPIYNHLGNAIACLSCAMPLTRYSEQNKPIIQGELGKHSKLLSRELGFAFDDDKSK